MQCHSAVNAAMKETMRCLAIGELADQRQRLSYTYFSEL